MGRRITPKYPRTAIATLLTMVAVAVPCAFWFVAGHRQLDREAQLREKSIYGDSLRGAVVDAEQLTTRFELLRESESRRPFYHYQNLFHDPKGAAEGLAVSVSPLAQSQGDPLIEAHFQVDAAGRLSLPTLNEAFPELGLQHEDNAQCELLWKLKDVATFCDIEAETGLVQDFTDLWREEYAADPADGFDVTFGNEVVRERLAPLGKPITQWLTTTSWRQHLAANDLYADLKYGKNQTQKASTRPVRTEDKELVRISTAPVVWRTLPVGGRPSLVALRAVETPAGRWTQGFSIDAAEVRGGLKGSTHPAFFEPMGRGPGAERGMVTVPVDGTGWGVRLDISSALAEADAAFRRAEERFLGVFALGACGAGLAGLLLVAMVFYSERLAQQRAQFAAAAAHELRTPLAGLRLYGEMLAEGLGDPSRSRDYARRLAGEAERLGRVVTNVLSFTRLERGSININPEVGDLQPAVLEAYQRQRPALEEAGANVELNLDGDLPPVRFDRDAVHHIVQNLLDNAEKYTRETENRRIVLALEGGDDEVVLTVSDNGQGIAKHLRRTLFSPFTRGDHKDSPEGLGLGLLLVRMLARAQGADITYRDAEGGGAELRVAFPTIEAA